MPEKIKYRFNDYIQINRTGSSILDGKKGRIVGIASSYTTVNFYIVELYYPILDQTSDFGCQSCIVMIESCLDKLT